MPSKLGNLTGILVGLLAVLQLGVAGAVIAITAIHMMDINSIEALKEVLHQDVCLLTPDNNTSICIYAYALGAVSIVFTFAIGLLQICTCGCCGCGAAMDSAFSVLAAAWWVAGAFVVSTNSSRANKADVERREWREAVAWLCWIGAILFGALFAAHASRLLARYCSGRRRGQDADKAVGTERPRSAALELGKEVRGRAYMTGGGAGGGLQQQFGTANNI